MSKEAIQLIWAARDGDIATVRRLLARGRVDVNVTDEVNGTPLYWASQNGHHVIVQSLLAEKVADMNIALVPSAQNPLWIASFYGHLNVVNTLLEEGANANQASKDNTTPLYVASQNGHHDVVQSLLAGGADVDIATSDDGRSPLFTASSKGHFDIVKTLIDKGANINQARKDGWTPLHVATYTGCLDIVKTLIEAGAIINQADKEGRSPLHIASYNERLDIVKTLIKEGANINQADKNGKTALDIAVENCRKEVIKVLKTSQKKVITPKARHSLFARQKAPNAKKQILNIKQPNNKSPQQQVQMVELRATRAEQQVRSSDERTIAAEQETIDSLQQKIRLQFQQAEERASTAEEKAKTAEERADEKAKTAEEKAKIAEEKAKAAEERASTAEEKARRANERAKRAEQNSNAIQLSWKIQCDEIEVVEGKPLGVGGWGEVRVAMFRGVKVAAKVLHEEIISPHNIDLFIREMNMAASVRHPNLILFIAASLDGYRPIILTELMSVNLRSKINIQPLSQFLTVSVGTDVASALNYLHLMRPDPIIHRDISSANVLLEPIESGYKAKVCDYGSANFLSKLATYGPGNASYSAPESSNPKLQSPKMDVYSYGILLFEMVTGQILHHNQQSTQLDTLVWHEMKLMIRQCICEDPVDRPSMKDVLRLLLQIHK